MKIKGFLVVIHHAIARVFSNAFLKGVWIFN